MITVGLTVLAWIGLFGWSVAKTIYDDRQALVAANTTISADREKLKGQLSDRDSKITAQQAEIDDLKKQVLTTKSTRPATPQATPGTAAPPILVGIRIASQKRIPSDDAKLAYGLEVVVQTDIDIEPVAIAVVCDGQIGNAHGGFASGGVYTQEKFGLADGHPNVFLVEWKSPTWTPKEPIVFSLFSEKPIRATSVQRVNYVWP
jgi:hypothetical protein